MARVITPAPLHQRQCWSCSAVFEYALSERKAVESVNYPYHYSDVDPTPPAPERITEYTVECPACKTTNYVQK